MDVIPSYICNGRWIGHYILYGIGILNGIRILDMKVYKVRTRDGLWLTNSYPDLWFQGQGSTWETLEELKVFLSLWKDKELDTSDWEIFVLNAYTPFAETIPVNSLFDMNDSITRSKYDIKD